jgi:hypothetical protein
MAEVEGSEQVDERPGWLPEAFRNPEALVESYNQAVGRLSQVSEEKHELEETLSAVLEAQEQEPVQVQPVRPQVDHLGVLKMLAEGAARSAVRQVPAHGPFDIAATSHAQQVERLVAADPELRGIDIGDLIGQIPDEALATAESTVNALKGLAYLAQVDQLHTLSGLTAQVAQQESRLAKIRAQSASGAAGRPQITSGETDADYANSLLEVHRGTYASRMASVNR